MPDNRSTKDKRALYRRSLVLFHHRRIFMAVTVLVVLFFVVNLLTPSKDYSEAENRALAKRPGIRGKVVDGSFSSDFDTYYSDQFTFRNQFIKLKFIGDTLLHIKETNGVLIGKDKYQFEIPEAPDKKLEKKTVDAINDFFDEYEDIPMSMMVVPASAAVLKDKLPSNAVVEDQVKDINAFYEKIDEDIGTIDVASILKEADQENLYYRTDHHWTSQGAYSVFTGSTEELGIEAPVGYNKYTVSSSFRGTLSSKSGDFVGSDTVEIYVPKGSKISYYVSYPASKEKRATIFKPEMLDTKDHYTVFFGGNHPLVEINTSAGTGKNLLLLKDSYANSFVQFLIPYYDRIIMVDPRYYYDNLNMVISNYSINEMLLLYSADTLFTDTSLSDTLEAALQDQKEKEKAEKEAKEQEKAEQEETDQTETEQTETEEAETEQTESDQAEAGQQETEETEEGE